MDLHARLPLRMDKIKRANPPSESFSRKQCQHLHLAYSSSQQQQAEVQAKKPPKSEDFCRAGQNPQKHKDLREPKPNQNRGLTKGWFSKRVVLAGCSPWNNRNEGTFGISDVPRERKLERGHVRTFPWNENRNEGTFARTTLLRNRPFVNQ